MASLITPRFEQYIAEQTVAKGTVVFDEFIFANIPGLTEANLARHLTMPATNRIVHRQAVSQAGVVNENAVVYSVTMGTEIGDFDFNFIGLVNKSKNLLAVAVQTNTIKKLKNKNNVQGNSLTRNILLEFSGAKALTGINVSAQTWQIDFTLRLHGLDEKVRLTNRDLYGRAVFFNDGFKVKKVTNTTYSIHSGSAYVEGVRMDRNTDFLLTATPPCSIYADVVHHSTVTGAYETNITFLKASKNDYIDSAGKQHYVQILADIDRNGNVTDRRILSPFLQMPPKDLDENSRTEAGADGHTHRLPLASLLKKGIVKLYSKLDSNSEELALTAKAGKTLKDLIDGISRHLNNNFILNSKKSNAIDSNSADTVATSLAVKTLNERVNITKIPVKGANTAVTFNLTNKANWISEIGTVYRNGGHFQLTLHNNASQNISNLPLRDKSPVQIDVSVMGEFSKVQCHYLTLNRTFISRIDWNASTFTLNWHEVVMKDQHGKIPREVVFSGSLEGNYRLVLRRNDPRNPPYFWVIDNGINIDEDITTPRVISDMSARVGKTNVADGTMKATFKTRLLTDKNVEQELTVVDARSGYKRLFTGFSKTGNLAIGTGADNGVDRLQVSGTVSAHAPPDSANNNQVPNTFWVRRFVGIMVETAKRWIKEEYWVNKELNAENLNDVVKVGVYAQRANVRATAALNYPDAVAGTLFVTPSAYGIQQEYTTHTGRKYVRGKQYNADAPATWRSWQRVDSIDTVKRAGDTMTGALTAPSLKVHHIGGAYANQYNTEAPFYVNRDRATSTNTYYPFIKGAVRDVGQWGTAFSFGYTTKQGQGDGFGRGVIHLQEDNGNQKTWLFEHNGDFSSAGDVIARINGRKLSETVRRIGNAHDIQFRWGGLGLEAKIDTTEIGAIHYSTRPYVEVRVHDGSYGGLDILRQGSAGNWRSRLEALPDKRWKFWVEGSHDIYLPARGGTVLLEETLKEKTQYRNYTKTIRGNNPHWDNGAQQNIAVAGQVITELNGRISQIIHLKDVRIQWFNQEEVSVGLDRYDRGIEIYQQLWTAMPNKIINVTAQVCRPTNPHRSAAYHSEASEWVVGWNLRKQAQHRDRFWLNLRRIAGGADEHVDIYIIVEGY